jgi:hypothetical protein
MAYHGQRWTFDVSCVYNPAATALLRLGKRSRVGGDTRIEPD